MGQWPAWEQPKPHTVRGARAARLGPVKSFDRSILKKFDPLVLMELIERIVEFLLAILPYLSNGSWRNEPKY